jgi:hypothetical protein
LKTSLDHETTVRDVISKTFSTFEHFPELDLVEPAVLRPLLDMRRQLELPVPPFGKVTASPYLRTPVHVSHGDAHQGIGTRTEALRVGMGIETGYATNGTRKSHEISVLQRAYRPRATKNENAELA